MEDREILIDLQNTMHKTQNKLNPNILALAIIILTAALLRIIPHPPNFAPVGALALFSGAKLAGKKAFVIPLFTMLISDLFLGFHSTIVYVYFSFVLIVFIGRSLNKNSNAVSLVSASLLSSILFFLITNFGVWASSHMYTKNLPGLINAYLMGVPFFRNTFVSDLLFTFTLFYGFNFIISYAKKYHLILTSKVK